MNLDTKNFGIIEIDENKIIDFPEGVPGFSDVKKFTIIYNNDDDTSPFMWLQGVDNPDLAFVIIDPRMVKSDYIVQIENSEVDILDIKEPENVLIFSIVTIPDDISKITANLKAPVIINTENNKGKQVILENSDYEIRCSVMEELQKSGGGK